ncbi:MAG: hypothetical protein K6E29_04755 [Cyanobacteria bacterium RUI128]|nr:hypothetical protein [Cyanobacteria bacterium RUI128]
MKAILLSEQVGAGAGAFKDGYRAIIGEGRVLSDFSKAEKKELGKEIVDFIKSFGKGDKLKPLDKDTVYFSTSVRPELKNTAGEVVCPRERVLHIDKPLGEGEGCGVTVSTNPLVLEDGHICSYPMTLDGVKAAFKCLMESAEAISKGSVK